MINLGDAKTDNERLVLELIRAMELGTLPEAVDSLCSNDFVWANSGLEIIKGKSELFEHMAAGGFSSQIPILQTMTHFSAELLHMASSENIVFTERVDHHWNESGQDLMTPHICGVAEISDNKISAFRDFYDVACYEQQPTEVQVGFDLGSFRARQQKGEA